MKRVCKVALARVPLLLFLLTFALGGAGAGVVERTGAAPKLSGAVHALFDLRTPAGGPFPSDRFTVADRSHLTGRRVHLPKPNCVSRPSDCQDLDVINTLDGFNLQPRLSIPFDGPINVNTVTSRTVFL
ncbi:MAG TPA: hypothetical protein VFM39_07130, partial [bacterium]|nr:hypothetical protein [bacterium]